MKQLVHSRSTSVLGLCLVLSLVVVFIVGGHLGTNAAASNAPEANSSLNPFIGFWMGVDPADGSFIKTSIANNDFDQFAEVDLSDTFSTVCGADRAILSGSGVVDGRVLVVDLTITCVDEFGDPVGDPFITVVEYERISPGILELTTDVPGLLPTTFFKVSGR